MIAGDKTRVQISMADGLLAQVDALAEAAGVTRSDILALAAVHYIGDFAPTMHADEVVAEDAEIHAKQLSSGW